MKSKIFAPLLFTIFAGCVYFLTQAHLQSMHFATTNGLWKSITLNEYSADPGWHRIIPANALLYPLHAMFGSVYDLFPFLPIERWRQMGLTNGFFGALSAGVCYFFAYRWTQRHHVAFLASSAYCFAGFVYLHAVTNEDIMPAYFFCLTAMFLAADWFTAPRIWQVVVVSAILSIGWLIEWRVMFPALPPLVLTLVVSQGASSVRITRALVFLGIIILAALLFASLSWVSGYRTLPQVVDYAKVLLWTGKGVGSGWGGFTTDKVWLLFSAMSEAIFGGRYITDPNWLWSPRRWSILIGLVALSAMAVSALWYSWQNRTDPTARTRFFLFFGLLVAGGVFNAYSQPADPQMQVNIMLVALPGWVLLIGGILSARKRLAKVLSPLAVVMIVAPITFSYYNMNIHRGEDAQDQTYIREISAKLNLSETIFLYHDFDGTITWLVANYGSRAPTGVDLPPAPSTEPMFKWIGYVRETVQNPSWTGERHAQDIINQVHKVMDLGYKVVTPVYWTNDKDYWILAFSSVASSEKAAAIHHSLSAEFVAGPLLSMEYGDDFVELHK